VENDNKPYNSGQSPAGAAPDDGDAAAQMRRDILDILPNQAETGDPAPPDASLEDESSGVGQAAMIVLGVVVGALIAGGAMMYLLQDNAPPMVGDIPVIEAETTVNRIQPISNDGMVVSDQDKMIYDRVDHPGQTRKAAENLLPPPVEPRQPDASTQPDINSILKKIDEEPILTADQRGSLQPLVAKKVDAVPEPKAAAEQPAAQPKPDSKKVEMTKPAQQKSAETKTEPKPAPKVKPEPQKAAPAKSAPPADRVVVQILASSSADKAEKAWATLAAQHKALLGGVPHHVVRADLGSRGVFYRLRAGDFKTRTEADAFCKKLKAAKISCIPVR
jgi:cell division septation protein DedD